jgi:hypothetical protein
MLGKVPTPSVEQLNTDSVNEAVEIDAAEFEKPWALRRSARIMTTYPLNHEGGEPS